MIEKSKWKSGIIDVHAHVLPGIDDGAKNWEQSRRMLKMAYAQGIRCIIATPHYRSGQSETEIRALIVRLNEFASSINPSLFVVEGQEVFYSEGFVDDLKRGNMLSMAGSRYILIEFRPDVSYGTLYQGIRTVVLSCHIPILAHAERYRCLRQGERLTELIDSGCCIQMNFESIQGNAISADVRWCKKQIAEKKVDFLGTDMHHMKNRKPDIEKALHWLEHHVGNEMCERILRTNPECILKNQNIR